MDSTQYAMKFFTYITSASLKNCYLALIHRQIIYSHVTHRHSHSPAVFSNTLLPPGCYGKNNSSNNVTQIHQIHSTVFIQDSF